MGADTYLAEQVLEDLLARWVGGDRADSVQVLRGDETTWARVLEAARTGSLFASRRAVVVRGADGLKGEGDELSAYLEDPSPDARLVFMASKPDKRRVVWKKLLERAQSHSAEPLKGRAARGYVADQVRRRQLALRDEAFEELFERVGQDLRRLMGELEKLEAFAEGQKGPLSAEEVAAVLGRGLAQPLYRIGDAFTTRRRAELLALMETVLEEGEPPLKVLATLHYAARRVRAARALRDARVPREALASRLGVPPFKVQELMEASRAWSEAELETAVAALSEADRRVK
ncbi:MAG TPA: DNA polymerase III subunit delta, partial [Vicinamibacteria bacterium]